jgi:hypothetical protein
MNTHVQSRETELCQRVGANALHAGKRTKNSKARNIGCDRKNLSTEGLMKAPGYFGSSILARCITKMCKEAERPNITTERVVRWARDGGDEREMGKRIAIDRRSKTRRKMACHRRVQKSASELAAKGALNIGGQLSGWDPSETNVHFMKV